MAAATECTTSPTAWAALILSIISMNVAWWLVDLPILLRHGLKQYLHSVTWQCFRLYMPAVAAIYALMAARTPEEEAFIYYAGPFYDVFNAPARRQDGYPQDDPRREDERRRGMTRVQFFKALLVDLLSICSTILGVIQAVHTPANVDQSGVNSSLWTYPSLPVSIIGLWLLLTSALRWSRAWTIWLGLLIVVLVGVALALPLALLSPAAREGKMWILAVIGYGYMALPIAALNLRSVVVMAAAFGVLFRVGGVSAGALAPAAYFPFCQLKSKAFGVAYLVVGIIGAVLAIWGWIWFYRRFDPKQNPRNLRGRVTQEGDVAAQTVLMDGYGSKYPHQPGQVVADGPAFR